MPPLTIENASALVGGISPAEKSMQAPKQAAAPSTLRVRALRAFQDHERKVLKPGDIKELPRIFALEMQAANKVELAPLEEPAAEAPAAPEPKAEEPAAIEKPRRGKEKANVG